MQQLSFCWSLTAHDRKCVPQAVNHSFDCKNVSGFSLCLCKQRVCCNSISRPHVSLKAPLAMHQPNLVLCVQCREAFVKESLSQVVVQVSAECWAGDSRGPSCQGFHLGASTGSSSGSCRDLSSCHNQLICHGGSLANSSESLYGFPTCVNA